MEAFYPEIRLVHIVSALASGGLAALMGILVHAGMRWGAAAPLHWLAYALDTILLTAALMLMTIVQQYPLADAWLTVKILLLTAYAALRHFAFQPGLARRRQIACWLSALAIFGYIVSVARRHDPLGLFGALT